MLTLDQPKFYQEEHFSSVPPPHPSLEVRDNYACTNYCKYILLYRLVVKGLNVNWDFCPVFIPCHKL